jgi:hypothetical protein
MRKAVFVSWWNGPAIIYDFVTQKSVINKWWEVTGDIRVVDPATTNNETAVIAGVSTRIIF